MDPIIRIPAISAVRRRLGRPNETAAVSTMSAFQAPAAVEPGGIISSVAQGAASEQGGQSAEFDLKVKMQIEQETAAARTEAERRGFVTGLERGEDLAKKEVAEQLARFASIAASLNQARESVLDNAEAATVEIVYTAVCRIIGDLAVTREAVASMVNQVLRSFQQHDELVVNLNPQDLDLIQTANDPHIAALAGQCTLRADSSIRFGGCIVEGSGGTLDARLEVQLAHLRETLLAVRKNRDNPGEIS